MSNRAALYKVLWKGYSAEIWIRPNVLEEAKKNSINDQNMIIASFKKILNLGIFIKFNDLRIRSLKPRGKKVSNDTKTSPHARQPEGHCQDINCDHCGRGHYDRCPNNYDGLP